MPRMTWLAAGLLVACLSGCAQGPPARLNSPPQGLSAYPHPLQQPFLQMTDNAALADMSVADIHFVAHTAELNGLGQRRLDRYVALLKRYGGRLRYDTVLQDRALIKKRLGSVRRFLKGRGLKPERASVAVALPGGRGMAAAEAIIVYKAAQAGGQEEGSLTQELGQAMGLSTGGKD